MKDGGGILAGGGTIGSGKASLEDASGVVAGGGGRAPTMPAAMAAATE